jgi:hypothetical protein
MATSGSYNWSLNRDELILMAFQEINVYGTQDSSVSTEDSTFAVRKLNAMLKMWSIDGVKTPKRKIGFLFPALDTVQYNLGSISGSSHCTNSYIKTTISADEAAGQTVLSLTSTSGMTASDNIGIELDDGSRQWTTIVSVDSSTQVTVTAALTGASASGNTVVTYTSKINKPLKIIYATKLNLNSNQESEINVEGHDAYYKTPNKTLEGSINNIYYDKQISGARPHYSSLYVYPEPSSVDEILRIIYTDAIQDLDSSSDDIDLPQEWLYPVMFNLASELAFSYGKFIELEKIQPKADMMYQLLKDASYDDEPVTFKLRVGK